MLVIQTSERSLPLGRIDGKINVLLRRHTYVERGRVDELIAHANVTLLDQNASVVNGLGEALF